MRREERDPVAATEDVDGLVDAPDAIILVVLLLVAARDDAVRLTVGRFILLLLEGGCLATAGFFSLSFLLIEVRC